MLFFFFLWLRLGLFLSFLLSFELLIDHLDEVLGHLADLLQLAQVIEYLLLVFNRLFEVLTHFHEFAKMAGAGQFLLLGELVIVHFEVARVGVSEDDEGVVEDLLAEQVVDDLVHLSLHLRAVVELNEEVLELLDEVVELLLLLLVSRRPGLRLLPLLVEHVEEGLHGGVSLIGLRDSAHLRAHLRQELLQLLLLHLR